MKILLTLAFLLLAGFAYAQQFIAPITDNTITVDGDFVEFIVPANTESITLTLTGTFSSINRVDASAFNDQTRWATGNFVQGVPIIHTADNSADFALSAVGTWVVGNVGWQRIRVYGADWTSGTVVVTAIGGKGGVNAGGGGGGAAPSGTVAISQSGSDNDVDIASPVNVVFSNQAITLIPTNEPSIPFGFPTISINEDGTIATFGSLNYHNNAPLLSQDGPVDLCKSWPGLPTPVTFNTNLSWKHCNEWGDQFTVPALNGVALYPAAAVIAAATATPTVTKIGTYGMRLNGTTWDPEYVCDIPFIINTAASGNTQLVALSGTTIVRVCNFHLDAEGTVDVSFVRGTGANCGTGENPISGVYAFSTTTGVLGTNESGGQSPILKSTAGNAVCVKLSAGVQVNGHGMAAQF